VRTWGRASVANATLKFWDFSSFAFQPQNMGLTQEMLERIFDSIAKMELTTDFGRENVQVWLLSYAPGACYTGILTNCHFRLAPKGNLFHKAPIQGWLKKQGGRFTLSWKRRWFILSGNSLYYFKKQDDGDPLGFFPLEGLAVQIPGQGKKTPTLFQLVPDPSASSLGLLRDSRVSSGSGNGKGTGTGTGTGEFVKSVRNSKRKGFSRGQHKKVLLKASTPEDAKQWVREIQASLEIIREELDESLRQPRLPVGSGGGVPRLGGKLPPAPPKKYEAV
jgi:hypothetical protein